MAGGARVCLGQIGAVHGLRGEVRLRSFTSDPAAITGVAATPDGGGYWLVGWDGGVYAYGDANFMGSLAGMPMAAPVTSVAAVG